EDAWSNADIADHLMREGKWKEALPYAERSAKSYSGRGLECAADCYEGLQNWSKANDMYRRIAERYEYSKLPWYVWCRRTGHGDLKAARAAAQPFLVKSRVWMTEEYQLAHGVYADLEDNPREALKFYATASRGSQHPYYAILAFLTA